MQYFNYRREIQRKLFHLTSLWMPCAVSWLVKPVTLALFIVALLGMLLFEWLRQRENRLAAWLWSFFSPIIRPHESHHLTGATYMLVAAILVTALFPAPIAATALAVLMISDSLAALVGRKFGVVALAGKTLEGSAAFLVSALVVAAVIQPASLLTSGIIACIAATAGELFAKPLKIDDNLCIPITFALAQWLCLTI